MSVHIGGAGFRFGISRPQPIKLKRGESIVVYDWKWWPPGWKKKLIQIDSSGKTSVLPL